jgi:hypothetical protein
MPLWLKIRSAQYGASGGLQSLFATRILTRAADVLWIKKGLYFVILVKSTGMTK